ncbi:MAG: hypothetical protein ABEK50_03200 [bacterium]
MIPLNSDQPDEESSDDGSSQLLSLEERVIQWTLVVMVPFLITFIAFGVIILAFSQWKLY